MERKLHPSHDWTTWKRLICYFAGALVSVGALLLVGQLGSTWPKTLGTLGFLAAFAGIVLTPVNRCQCPGCGQELRRSADTTEFVCNACGIVWYTHSFGYTLRG